ncbi:MAG: type IV pilin protein [Actinomycetota bacterium]
MSATRTGARRDDGFTLVELMIVILIIGVLIAIGLPTFLGARERAQDRTAQALLRNALTAAKVYYTDHMEYDTFDATAAEAIEPSISFIKWTGSERENIGEITMKGVQSSVSLSTESASGHVFCIVDSGTGTTYGRLEAVGGQPCWVSAVQYPTPQQGWAPPP